MDPAQTFNQLLDEVKRSNLNYQVIETPFSASIHIKKTFIKDRNGSLKTCVVIPYCPVEEKRFDAEKDDLIKKNEYLQAELLNIQNDYEGMKVEAQQFQIKEQILEKKKADIEQNLEVKMDEIALLKKTLKNQEGLKNEMKKDMDDLNKTLRAKEKEIVKLTLKAENLSSNTQALKAEVSKLKKENNRLEKSAKKGTISNNKQLQSSSLSPSLDSSHELLNNNLLKPCTHSSSLLSLSSSNSPPSPSNTIHSSTSVTTNNSLNLQTSSSDPLSTSPTSPSATLLTPPSTSESSSSSTKKCTHESQCVIRQPKQPPPDKCKILVHKGSKYHVHMDSEEGVPARYNTHDYCMRIEYENYGCADCIWFKWWGELHGYPDINPWSFKEHLEPVTYL